MKKLFFFLPLLLIGCSDFNIPSRYDIERDSLNKVSDSLEKVTIRMRKDLHKQDSVIEIHNAILNFESDIFEMAYDSVNIYMKIYCKHKTAKNWRRYTNSMIEMSFTYTILNKAYHLKP